MVTANGLVTDVAISCLRVAQVNLTQATIASMVNTGQPISRPLDDLRLTFVTNRTLCDYDKSMKDLAISDLVTVIGHAIHGESMAIRFPVVNMTSQHNMDIPLQVNTYTYKYLHVYRTGFTVFIIDCKTCII